MAGVGAGIDPGMESDPEARIDRAADHSPRWVPATGGVFAPLARRQYAALAAMRWRAFRNGLHSPSGAFEAAASGVSYLVYTIMGLAVTVGLAATAYSMASKGHWLGMPVLLWAVFAMWQLAPVVIMSFQQPFDLNGLLRFPMGFGPYYLLHVIFGVVDFATVLGGLGCLGILTGIGLADFAFLGWTAAALAVFGGFNVFFSRALFVWLDRWLGQRKTREIVSVVFLLGLLSLQFLNPELHRQRRPATATPESEVLMARTLAFAERVQMWLPPGVAEQAIEDGVEHHSAEALGALGLLGLWTLGTGVVLGVRLRALHRGEILSDSPRPKKTERPATAARSAAARGAVSLRGSGPVAAMIEKDWHTVTRSLPLLYALGAPLIMVVIIASLMRSSSGEPSSLALPMCIAYALLGFTQLIYNNLGTEGAGIQLLLCSPTPMRTVLLAKNIFHAMLFSVVAVLAGLLAVLRLGLPDLPWVVATVAWLVFALPTHLAVGNVLSLAMPHRVNLGRIGRQRGGQAGGLVAILVQALILGIGAVVIFLCSAFGHVWLASVVLLVLALPAVYLWQRVLANSDAMAIRRRDELISVLAKVE